MEKGELQQILDVLSKSGEERWNEIQGEVDGLEVRVRCLEQRSTENRKDIDAIKVDLSDIKVSIKELFSKLEGINKWLVGIMGGLCVSLVLLLINMSLGR